MLMPPRYILYWTRVWKKGDGESLAYSSYLDSVALLKPKAVQLKHSSGIAAKSMGKVPLDSDSSVGVLQDITSDNLSSHRLESMADQQREGREIQDSWRNWISMNMKGTLPPPNYVERWTAIGKATC